MHRKCHRLEQNRSEKFYAGIIEDSDLKVKLTGAWEVIVGELDTFGELCATQCRLMLTIIQCMLQSMRTTRVTIDLRSSSLNLKYVLSYNTLSLPLLKSISLHPARESTLTYPSPPDIAFHSIEPGVCVPTVFST